MIRYNSNGKKSRKNDDTTSSTAPSTCTRTWSRHTCTASTRMKSIMSAKGIYLILVCCILYLFITTYQLTYRQQQQHQARVMESLLSLSPPQYSSPKNIIKESNDKKSPETELDVDSTEHFSACILWMDDNHRLEEWLAYHYYLLELRYVVINIDANSKTSPNAIIDRWNNNGYHNLNMTIVTMNETDYILPHEYKTYTDKIEKARNSSDTTKLGNAKTLFHRRRQPEFYRACSAHLINHDPTTTWTSYHDVDEFVSFQHIESRKPRGSKKLLVGEGLRKLRRPGYVLDRLNAIKEETLASRSFGNITTQSDNNDNVAGNFSCVAIDRIRFCAEELTNNETLQLKSEYEIPNFLESNRFDTLRYKYTSPGVDGMPKSIIDLSQERYVHTTFFLGH